MLAKIEELDGALQCPRTARPIRFVEGRVTLRDADGDGEVRYYPVADNKPVLIDFENSVIKREDVVYTSAASVIERPSYSFATKFIKSLLSPEKRSTKHNIATFIDKLKGNAERPRVL